MQDKYNCPKFLRFIAEVLEKDDQTRLREWLKEYMEDDEYTENLVLTGDGIGKSLMKRILLETLEARDIFADHIIETRAAAPVWSVQINFQKDIQEKNSELFDEIRWEAPEIARWALCAGREEQMCERTLTIADIQEFDNDPYDFVKSEIRELLEKALWGDEDATLYGQVNSGGLDMIKLMELKAQMATISANLARLTEVIENPKVKLGEEIEDFEFSMGEEPANV